MKPLIMAVFSVISTLTMAGMAPSFAQGQNPPGGFDDHQNMMNQLGVKALRPGPDPNDQSTFSEATANPYKDTMPNVLRMNDGTMVTRASQWPKRRAEIAEDFEREVYGRIPNDVPKVTLEVTASWQEQAIAHGWAYGSINPTSVQPDNNDLTTAGIIGLTNKGQPRKPDDWGALRAWQWGVSRMIDYFEAHPEFVVDSKKVGIEGLSRYGKAAIVTEAFDPRVAVGLIGSSGEGGVKLYRHIFGEGVENLAGGEYYWMAGNFMKYGASDPPMTAANLPVDSHELIAMCAPRPCFISYGVVEHGDAKWVDAHGSFMAAVLAGPVYRLLGKQGLGTPGDYLSDPMPPVGQLIGGELAWRQHDGGHDVTPNWPSFFTWVARYIKAPEIPKTVPAAPDPATPAG
jgi:hypothetical protein